MRRLLLLILFLIPFSIFGDENARFGEERAAVPKHFVLHAEHTLLPAEQAQLAVAGVEIQHALPGQRYVVRTLDPEAIAADPRVAAIETISPAKKIARSALSEAARGLAFARIRIVFHDDVSFADAQRAIAGVGGIVDGGLMSEYAMPQRLQARIPFARLPSLASDDRVLAIYGPARRITALNAVAAQVSHVTPLFSPPYGLSGSGVVLSAFELAPPYTAHPEFGGRLINHVVGGSLSNQAHATHVSGTIIAAGINPAAKGMAPQATLHIFDADPPVAMPTDDSYALVINTKASDLTPLSIAADNNSWGFALGWQFEAGAANRIAWTGGEELYGVYDGYYSSPYDKVAKTSSILFVQSSGNDADLGNPSLPGAFSPHGHTDVKGIFLAGEVFCYSQDGTGTDCTGTCSAGPTHCEVTKHPIYGPFTTVGPTGSLKDVISVGAVDSAGQVAGFSARGPTLDGRVKPDLVAKGVQQLSTMPGGSYARNQGTSMSAPVITGIAGLLVEQWRRTFAGANPLPIVLKTLLIAGADDLGTKGPDYTYGFGLADAKASVDLILADGNTGSHIQLGTITHGQQVEIPLGLGAAQNLRVVAGWTDPEVVLGPDESAGRALINDLDLKVIGPSGNAVLPYVLDKALPGAAATRGKNSVDNTEEVEIDNAAAGVYRVILTGFNVPVGPQQYVVITNGVLGSTSVQCNDPFEPNDTETKAYGFLINAGAINASTCSVTDVDFYKIRTSTPGPLSVSVTATDTALRVTLSGNGITPVVQDVAAGSTGTVSTQAGSGTAVYIVRVEPTGIVGPIHTYTLLPRFSFIAPPRHRASRH